jgi:hypothetical protein
MCTTGRYDPEPVTGQRSGQSEGVVPAPRSHTAEEAAWEWEALIELEEAEQSWEGLQEL